MVRIVRLFGLFDCQRHAARRRGYGVSAEDEGSAGAGDFGGDFRGGYAASACRYLHEVKSVRDRRDLTEVDRFG